MLGRRRGTLPLRQSLHAAALTSHEVPSGARHAQGPRACFLPAAASRCCSAIELFPGGGRVGVVIWEIKPQTLSASPQLAPNGCRPHSMLAQGQELEWVACIFCCQSPQSRVCLIFIFPSLSDMCQGIRAGNRSITSFCRPVSV